MKGAAPLRLHDLQNRRRLAAAATASPTPPAVERQVQTPVGTPSVCTEVDSDIEINTSVTTTHLRYSGMLDVPHFMCTCGTVVGVHRTRDVSIQEYQALIGSNRPCCSRFFTLKRYTFCSNFDLMIGPQGQEAASTRKSIKISAVVRRPIE